MGVCHRVHRPARGLPRRECLLAKVAWLAAVAISFQVSGQVRTPESDRECPPFHRPIGQYWARQQDRLGSWRRARRAQRARPARRLCTLHTRLRPDRQPAHRGSPQLQPLAPRWPTKAAQTRGIPSVMCPCHSWTQRDTAGPGASTQIRLDVLDLRKCRLKTLAHRPRPRAGRSRAPRSAYAADQPGSGPPLAHSNRERSAGPLPDTYQTRHPGTPEAGLTWGFVWQVLGSNQRRLSRRFYSEPIPTHRNSR
jgi:hypothetical protein